MSHEELPFLPVFQSLSLLSVLYRYENVFLTEAEYAELKAEFPDRLERLIEEMSRYLAANGKSYQNYAAALRIWAGNDKKEAPKKGIPDYSCKEGESL